VARLQASQRHGDTDRADHDCGDHQAHVVARLGLCLVRAVARAHAGLRVTVALPAALA